jgi:hypothetical protein
MHCPNCGQKQVTEQIKFCSRCGFPLGLISEILSHGGFLPQLAELNKKRNLFTKKNGVMMGIFWFMFFVLIMTPLWGIIGVEEMAGASAVIGVFGALMIVVASLVFLRSSKVVDPALHGFAQMPPHLQGRPSAQALPPSNEIPASAYVPPPAGRWRMETDELGPGSVTEGTTKLLEHEQEKD